MSSPLFPSTRFVVWVTVWVTILRHHTKNLIIAFSDAEYNQKAICKPVIFCAAVVNKKVLCVE